MKISGHVYQHAERTQCYMNIRFEVLLAVKIHVVAFCVKTQCYRAVGLSGNALTCTWKVLVSNRRILTIMTEVFHCFPQALHANSRIVSKLDNDHILPHPFTIH